MRRIFLSMAKKREIIALKWNVKGERRKVSLVTLQSALGFRTKTALADALRAAAMQRGGVLYDDNKAPVGYRPACTTHYNANTGMFTCDFGNGYLLAFDGNTDTAELTTPDSYETFNNVSTISQILKIQHQAQTLVEAYNK